MKIMKRLCLMTVILMLSILMISCNTENTDESISDGTSSENEKIYAEKIDNTFPLLIGKSNEQLKEIIDGRCSVGNSDFDGVYLCDNKTGIRVYFSTLGISMWQDGSGEIGDYNSNPLNDQLVIRKITISSDINNDVIDQTKLKLVFDTENTITYETVNTLSGQTPEIVLFEGYPINTAYGVVTVKPETEYFIADYICENANIRVFFVNINDEKVAEYIEITAKE